MARTKKISDKMDDLKEALAEFRAREVGIRAEYARLAEEKIAESRDNVLDLMFIKHAASGPSEIANTIGVSRSTVIRWRAEFMEREANLPDALQIAADMGVDPSEAEGFAETAKKLADTPEFNFTLERSEESNEDVHLIQKSDGQAVYVIWGDTFVGGETPDDAEVVERPDWLTDAVLSEAESVTGMDIPGAIHR